MLEDSKNDVTNPSTVKLMDNSDKMQDDIYKVEDYITIEVPKESKTIHVKADIDKEKMNANIEEIKKKIEDIKEKLEEMNKPDFDISTMMVEDVWRAYSLEVWRKT